jgi:hypothetical protein
MPKTFAGTVKWVGIQPEIVSPQPVPQFQLPPSRLVANLLIVGQEWVRQHERHHLFIASVVEAYTPRRGASVVADPAIKLRVRAPADSAKLGSACPMFADAQVEMPATEVDSTRPARDDASRKAVGTGEDPGGIGQ